MHIRTALLLLGTLPSVMHAAMSVHVGGGMNISDFSEDANGPGEESMMRPGFNIAAGLDYFFNGNFGVASGIGLETRGQKNESTEELFGSTLEIEGSANYLYLQIPLLAKAQFPAGPAFIQVLAGPEIGMPLSKEVEFKITEDGDSRTQTIDADLAAIDFGLAFGAAIRIPTGPVGLFLEPSYYLGLTNFHEPEDDPDTVGIDESEGAEEVMHRNIKLKLGIYKNL